MTAAKVLDDIVGDFAAVVVAFVEHRSFLVDLSKEVAVETRVATEPGVGQMDVSKLAAAELIDLAAISLDPGEMAELRFAFDRHYCDIVRARTVGIGSDAQDDLLTGGFLKEAVDSEARAATAGLCGEPSRRQRW